jgi:hypothetical protein
MPRALPTPSTRPDSVRTLLVGSSPCPVCGTAELQGRQTVCSARCRRERSRQRQAEALRTRDQSIRADLEQAAELVARAQRRLEETP